MSVKISHESPLELLEKSREYNDYDYCLVHLLPEQPQYREFFEDSVKMGRHVLLDNSIFELGHSFDPDLFAEWIVKLNPTEYIIPDVLEDTKGTIDSYNSFVEKFTDLPGKTIGVVQGKTYQELVECYLFMSANVDKIAISFDYDYYRITGLGRNKWEQFMNGRRRFIERLWREGIWNHKKPHHMLGCALPQEFIHYCAIKNIESLDTSNPVLHGMFNIRYEDHGLDEKCTTKLADSLENGVTDEQMEAIEYNIKMFRKMAHGE